MTDGGTPGQRRRFHGVESGMWGAPGLPGVLRPQAPGAAPPGSTWSGAGGRRIGSPGEGPRVLQSAVLPRALSKIKHRV